MVVPIWPSPEQQTLLKWLTSLKSEESSNQATNTTPHPRPPPRPGTADSGAERRDPAELIKAPQLADVAMKVSDERASLRGFRVLPAAGAAPGFLTSGGGGNISVPVLAWLFLLLRQAIQVATNEGRDHGCNLPTP